MTLSHLSLIHLLEKVSKGYNVRVKEWKDARIASNNWYACMDNNTQSDGTSSDSESESDSSWKSLSPITSSDDHDFSDSSSSGDQESLSASDNESSLAPPDFCPQQTSSTTPSDSSCLHHQGLFIECTPCYLNKLWFGSVK